MKTSPVTEQAQPESFKLRRILIALAICLTVLLLLMTQKEVIREYQLYFTEDRRDVAFQLTDISETWTEKTLRDKFPGVPLNCFKNPGNNLGDLACGLDTKSFNGTLALFISFFFSSGHLQQISINVPWWKHQAAYSYLLASLGQPTASQFQPHSGVRLHGWQLQNGAGIFYNRDQSLNPLEWNAINWHSPSLCATNKCFIHRKPNEDQHTPLLKYILDYIRH